MGEEEIEKLKAENTALEEQVKLLVKVEIELHRAQAELIKSNEKIAEYSKGLEQKVSEKTKEIQEKMNDLDRMNKIMTGRELRVIELKKEIEELEKKLGGA